MKKQIRSFLLALMGGAALALAGCGGGGGVSTPPPPSTYRIAGTVAGLGAGSQLTLLNNGGDSTVVTANGNFQFGTGLLASAAYAVTVGTPPPGQTCTVANGAGTVVSADVSSVAITCTNNPTHTVAAAVTGLASGASLELRLNNTPALSVTSNTTATFGTPIAEGVAYAVVVGTQPAFQTCSVTGGTGTMSTSNVLVTVACADNKQFALVTNFRNAAGGNSISVFEFNPGSGALAPVAGSPFSSQGVAPLGMAVNEAATHVFVTNSEDNTVVAFAMNAVTGALSMVGTPYVSPGRFPGDIAVNRASTAAYVVHGGTVHLTALTLSPSTGAITAAAQYNLGGTATPNYVRRTVAVSPAGNFVFVGDAGLGNVAVWAVNATTGVLTAVGTYSSGGTPAAVAVNPAGTQLLVGNDNGNVVRMAIASDGSLSAIGSATPSSTSEFSGLTFNRAGTMAFASHVGGGELASFLVSASTGELTVAPGGPFSSGGIAPAGIAVNTAGTFALVSNRTSENLSILTINASGALTPVVGSPVPAGPDPRAVAFAHKR